MGSFSYIIDEFSSVQSLSRVRLSATPWIAARQASLSITNSRSLLKLTSIESVMPSSHLILCRPLLLLPPILPSIKVFSNESTNSKMKEWKEAHDLESPWHLLLRMWEQEEKGLTEDEMVGWIVSSMDMSLSKLCVSCSVVSDSANPWTVARQAPLSKEFSGQGYWSGLPFPSPEDLPDPGIEPGSPALADRLFTSEPPVN